MSLEAPRGSRGPWSSLAHFALSVVILLSMFVAPGCGPRVDRATVLADVDRRWPGTRVTDMGVGEGDVSSQTWEIGAVDSLGTRVLLNLTYVRDEGVGWRLIGAERHPPRRP